MKGKEEMTKVEIRARISYWVDKMAPDIIDNDIEYELISYKINMDGTESRYKYYGECLRLSDVIDFIYDWTKDRASSLDRVCLNVMDYCRIPIVDIEF